MTHGYWFARSAEFLQSGVMRNLRWLRVIGDTVFAAGAFVLVYFVFALSAGYSIERGAIWSRDARQVRSEVKG